MTIRGAKRAHGPPSPDPPDSAEPDRTATPRDESRDSNVAAYKAILQRVLDNRPSGTRLRLAGALGKNRSFVTQITNPSYPVPIPARHVDVIMEVCHLLPPERAQFLKAYGDAHPGRRSMVGGRRQTRAITVTVPDFGDARRNRAYDQMLIDLAERLGRFAEGDR